MLMGKSNMKSFNVCERMSHHKLHFSLAYLSFFYGFQPIKRSLGTFTTIYKCSSVFEVYL